MGWTRTTFRTEVRHLADAENDTRWPNARIDAALDMVFRREWSNLLNANPYLRWAVRTPTPNSDGRIAITDLSSGSGDTAETFYRIIDVARGTRRYSQVQFRDAPLAASLEIAEAWSDGTWYRIGNQLQLIPV
ncbi:MAG: hypothetical protein ACTS5I_09000, partial [Rhodanobacter sp.]